MSEQKFTVKINGSWYTAFASTRGSSDSFEVYHEGSRTIADAFGECNPLRELWGDWRYQSCHGAARTAMEQRCIREAVEHEIESHRDFCLALIENGEIDAKTGEEIQ
jgi:hypothetical protein